MTDGACLEALLPGECAGIDNKTGGLFLRVMGMEFDVSGCRPMAFLAAYPVNDLRAVKGLRPIGGKGQLLYKRAMAFHTARCDGAVEEDRASWVERTVCPLVRDRKVGNGQLVKFVVISGDIGLALCPGPDYHVESTRYPFLVVQIAHLVESVLSLLHGDIMRGIVDVDILPFLKTSEDGAGGRRLGRQIVRGMREGVNDIRVAGGAFGGAGEVAECRCRSGCHARCCDGCRGRRRGGRVSRLLPGMVVHACFCQYDDCDQGGCCEYRFCVFHAAKKPGAAMFLVLAAPGFKKDKLTCRLLFVGVKRSDIGCGQRCAGRSALSAF